MLYLSGVNFDASAANALAGEVALLGLYEYNLAINSGMNRKVAAHESARASDFGCASLADENFAGFDSLATKALMLWMFLLVPPALTCDILYFFLNTII